VSKKIEHTSRMASKTGAANHRVLRISNVYGVAETGHPGAAAIEKG